MTLYLVRHGQTEFNRAGRYQGRLDSPLTALGVEQGRRIGQRLAQLLPDGADLVASPLGRAAHTARLVAEAAGLSEPRLDDRLMEVSLGRWDGMTDEDIEAVYPGARNGTDRWNWYFASPDGERYEQLAARAGAWLAEAAASPRPLVAVSHGVTGRVIRGLYAGLSRIETLKLPVPQDAVFRLTGGEVEQIDCAPLETTVNGR
ncbi:histidine phosphatase family protein [Caulobacter mirabilis]|uniref:Phosphoglycerate mutase n=1 Tax=Caulobacter mirabilis TaxID=69666 RepID=A0A2D2ATU1_9CAUL|nr:histidine phosphatase family protein [Caulobacter mirabilis]ATQ41419.1 phosphoglycerate mutase [Caulobacter mirabilis]